MGTITTRGTRAKPRYYARLIDRNGVRVMRALTGCRSMAEARARLAQAEARVANGESAFIEVEEEGRPATMGPLMETWTGGLDNRSAADDRGRISKYLVPAFGTTPLEDGQPNSTPPPQPVLTLLELGDRAGPRRDQPGEDGAPRKTTSA